MKHVKRKLAVVAGLGGLVAVAYKKLTGGKDETWESPYEPAAPPEATEASAEDVTPEPAAATGEEPASAEEGDTTQRTD